MQTRQRIRAVACATVLLAGLSACYERPAAPDSASNDPVALLNLGIEQGKAGRLNDAVATFERVLGLDETNKFAWFNLGYIAQSRNQIDTALASYDKALATDPAFKPALFNKALALEATQPKNAIDLYKKITSIDTKAATAYLHLGGLLAKQGDKAGAGKAFDAAVKLDATLAASIPAEYRARPSKAVPSATATPSPGTRRSKAAG